jgi:hypothetical protein
MRKPYEKFGIIAGIICFISQFTLTAGKVDSEAHGKRRKRKRKTKNSTNLYNSCMNH